MFNIPPCFFLYYVFVFQELMQSKLSFFLKFYKMLISSSFYFALASLFFLTTYFLNDSSFFLISFSKSSSNQFFLFLKDLSLPEGNFD